MWIRFYRKENWSPEKGSPRESELVRILPQRWLLEVGTSPKQ